MDKETIVTLNDIYEFKRCSLRYRLNKVNTNNDIQDDSDGLRNAIQSTLNYFYYKLQDGEFITMTRLKEKFSSIWYGELGLYEIKTDGDRKRRQLELQAVDMLHTFHRKQKYNPDKVVVVNLDFKVPFGDGFIVQDTIPLIRETNRGHEIVNFRTGTQSYNNFWQKTDPTVTLHAMAYESIFGKKADSIATENLRNSQTYYLERKNKDYKRLYQSIRIMKESIDKGWFYPNESFMCNKCPVQSLCLEWN